MSKLSNKMFLQTMAQHVKPDMVERMKNFLEKPTTDTWNETASICLGLGHSTVWQAIRKCDNTFPMTGRRYDTERNTVVKDWERIPSESLFKNAIIESVNRIPKREKHIV